MQPAKLVVHLSWYCISGAISSEREEMPNLCFGSVFAAMPPETFTGNTMMGGHSRAFDVGAVATLCHSVCELAQNEQ